MTPPRKHPYYGAPRALSPALRPLTPEQDQRRYLLRDCINLCIPYVSDAAFAREHLLRPPRTVRAWLSGYRPIPDYIVPRLRSMREYLMRKAREVNRSRDDDAA